MGTNFPTRSQYMSWYCVPHRTPDRPTRKIAVCSHCGTKSKVYTGSFQCENCGRADSNPVLAWVERYNDDKAYQVWRAKFGHYADWVEERERAAATGERADRVKTTCNECGAKLLVRNSSRHKRRCPGRGKR
jgi:ssDNA-binding Zn-finger/Zn-ribbon topoisomerase 1